MSLKASSGLKLLVSEGVVRKVFCFAIQLLRLTSNLDKQSLAGLGLGWAGLSFNMLKSQIKIDIVEGFHLERKEMLEKPALLMVDSSQEGLLFGENVGSLFREEAAAQTGQEEV